MPENIGKFSWVLRDEVAQAMEELGIVRSTNEASYGDVLETEIENVTEDHKLNRDLHRQIKIKKNFQYTDECILSKPPHITKQGNKVYKRDRQTAINALSHANFQCEINKEHVSFLRKNDHLPYMEAHHLIPMSKQHLFRYSLDIEENIVSLCSHCHNEIHYGENAHILIGKLFKERVSLLEKKNIFVTLETLLSYYE